MTKTALSALLLTSLLGCQVEDSEYTTPAPRPEASSHAKARVPDAGDRVGLATFAGGCFWCMEKPFEVLPGVSAVISGYTGGHKQDPTYREVCSGSTGHTESIQVHFDPGLIAYEDLLEVFWRQIDPTDSKGQFADKGSQYRPEIFYHSDQQRIAAEASRKALSDSGRFSKPIAVEITPASTYYVAEDYHQDYYKKEPADYKRYRRGSGRDRFLDKYWGAERAYTPKVRMPNAAAAFSDKPWLAFAKPAPSELRERLTDLQYEVTQEEGTERAFKNEYWDNKRAGIYVDVVSGEPLFSSEDKFKSGTGWPSFTRPLVQENIAYGSDRKIGYQRTEVRSKHGDSHLGHRFPDGPEPTGLRYCINSAALRFVPAGDLEREGYGEFAGVFGDS